MKIKPIKQTLPKFSAGKTKKVSIKKPKVMKMSGMDAGAGFGKAKHPRHKFKYKY